MSAENWTLLHVGLSVKNMDEAVKYFTALGGTTDDSPGHVLDSANIKGIKTYGKEDAPPWKIKIKMLNLGPLTFELTEPVEGDNFNKTYMDEHGEGANHIAYIVDNLDEEVAELEAKGIPAMYHASGIYAYMDARKVGGVVIELMQKRDRPPA
ncbi:MAG: VOC family protein [Dehalococcoidales bacterium]|nr:VOC family protein [Dehalococcoidales bacterium]